MQQANMLIRSVQINQLIGNIQEESELSASSEDKEVEDDDG